MFSLTLALTLVLVARGSAACDACVAGVCHSRENLLAGFRVTDQLAVDRAHNVLYTQLGHDQNIALFLDRPELRLLHTMRTSGMAVDQHTQTLYLGTKEIKKTFFKYHLSKNTTEAVLTDGDHMKPDLLFYSHFKLYFIREDMNGVRYVNSNKTVLFKTPLKNYTISDLVLDKNGNIFFVSNDKSYMHKYESGKQPTVIAQKKYVLSADGYGGVYFGDVSQKVIHKRDDTTGRLELYASYKSGSVKDFVFDRDNKIVFRDADGGVARWVPAPARARCRVEPPHQDYVIRVLTDKETCGKTN